jgi:hypothetical protein
MRINPTEHVKEANKAYDFLMLTMKNGQFGSGQVTILALKAISDYVSFHGANDPKIQFDLMMNNKSRVLNLKEEHEKFENSKYIKKVNF